jgi:hypothetical protein
MKTRPHAFEFWMRCTHIPDFTAKTKVDKSTRRNASPQISKKEKEKNGALWMKRKRLKLGHPPHKSTGWRNPKSNGKTHMSPISFETKNANLPRAQFKIRRNRERERTYRRTLERNPPIIFSRLSCTRHDQIQSTNADRNQNGITTPTHCMHRREPNIPRRNLAGEGSGRRSDRDGWTDGADRARPCTRERNGQEGLCFLPPPSLSPATAKNTGNAVEATPEYRKKNKYSTLYFYFILQRKLHAAAG